MRFFKGQRGGGYSLFSVNVSIMPLAALLATAIGLLLALLAWLLPG